MVMRQQKRVLTVEEARQLPPPTAADLARRRTVLEEARLAHEAYLAAGGRTLTREERQALWDEIDSRDEDD